MSADQFFGGFRLPVSDDEVSIKPGAPDSSQLRIIEWHHMSPALFYPAALFSTWTIRTALYPLAVLRSRLQLQKQNTVYRSTTHALLDTFKTEGIRGLYRGFWVTMPQIGCSFIYSTTYENVRATLKQRYDITSPYFVSSLSGACANVFAQIIFVPTDIVAQYMMVYKNPDNFVAGKDKAVLERVQLLTRGDSRFLGINVIRAIYGCDGIRGFYRGFWASVGIYAPYSFIFWSAYYFWLSKIHKLRNGRKNKSLLFEQYISATGAGITSTLLTNPMEMLRIRFQVHRTSYRETIADMIRNEGRRIFTKGLAPRLLSNSIYSGSVITGYEAVKRLCVLDEFKDRIKW